MEHVSRCTTRAEQIYHSYERETLAMVDSIRWLRLYLIGENLKMVTDCNAVRAILLKHKIARWWLVVQ